MKKTYRIIGTVMLLMAILFNTTGCRMVDSYKEFVVKNGCDTDDYLTFDQLYREAEGHFTAGKLDFARIEDVLIIPEVKEIDHGKYIVYVSVYSKAENKKITIKNVSMREGDKSFLNYELNEKILFEKNEQGIEEGWIEAGTFTDGMLKVADGKSYILDVQVEIEREEGIVTKDIEYELLIKGHKSFVAPV